MRVFEEKQHFNQWWLYAIYALVLFVLIGGIYKNSNGFQKFDNPLPVLLFLAAMVPMAFILILRQDTRIDPEGITVKFYPMGFSRKFFPWKRIGEVYVRKYSPIAEYGGWGVRGTRRRKAYNVAGNLGIQIVTTDKENFLIGTQKPDVARAVLKHYQPKLNSDKITSKMNKSIFSVLILIIFQVNFAQDTTFTEQQLSIDKFTDGTLLLPKQAENMPLIIFIQGSGPVNRDGNAPMMKNNGMRKISEALAEDGIASFRFDKRILKMNKLKLREEDLSFDDFVTDVVTIVDHFKKEGNIGKIVIAGHSEGSLIGILAAQKVGVDGFISLAGAGRPIDEIIVEQLSKQSSELSENAGIAFDEINQHGHTTNYSPYLESIFRPSVQPYIKSWMNYDPAAQIAELNIPILIINGSFDIQVDVTDAEILHKAAKDSKIVILDKMNHIFRKIEGEELENTKAYNEPNRPLHPDLIPTLVEFIKSI